MAVTVTMSMAMRLFVLMLVLMLVMMQCNPRRVRYEANVMSLANKLQQENIAVARSPSHRILRLTARCLL